ncbi:unnamed protein product [Pleuronectes platessa]|uniref:Uncharacterized protein n=1 Tax=Pleuronectes platessa TaxID=8262 RepID=A0A9N7U8V9_PLEPL|nr:unnamed protein product [Pleuronectes platessa]
MSREVLCSHVFTTAIHPPRDSVVSADSSGRDKVLMLGLKVTAPVLQPHSWGARDPSPHGIHRAARRQRRTDGWGQFRVQHLAQGHFGMQIRKTGMELPTFWLEDNHSTPQKQPAQ